VAKEFALTFRKLIAFAIRIGISIVVALKGFEHGRYNELRLEMSFFVGDAQLAAEAGKTISRLVQDCALQARLPSGTTPTESPVAGELIRLQRELATAKEQIGAARRELSANAATETDELTERHVQRDISTDIERDTASHKLTVIRQSQSSANCQLQKAKQDQAGMEILLQLTKDSLQRVRRDLRDARHELSQLRYHIDIEQMRPEERDKPVALSAKKQRCLKRLINEMCDADDDDE